MKEVFKKIILVLGIWCLFVSAPLCLIANIILYVYTIYKKIKTRNNKLNISIVLYMLQLIAYCGDYIGNPYYLSQFTISGSDQLFELIGFNILGIIATYILFKNKQQ